MHFEEQLMHVQFECNRNAKLEVHTRGTPSPHPIAQTLLLLRGCGSNDCVIPVPKLESYSGMGTRLCRLCV